MKLKRRSFLFLLGASGYGLTACLNQLNAGQPKTLEQPTLAKTSPSPPPVVDDRLAKQGITNPPRGDVRIVVISDLNSQYGSTDYDPEVDQAIALIPGWQPDLVLCGGDMIAGQSPSLSRAQIEAMWQAFDQHVAAPLRQAKIPYGFTLGNHDASGALGFQNQFLYQKERDLAADYWQDPAHNPGVNFVDRSGFPFYYSFAQNDLFFLVWDASTHLIPAKQLTWAEQSLSSPQAQQAKLRIAIGHLPLYGITVGRDEPGEYLERADQLRALLEKYNVHTYISGHDHGYYPGHVGKLQTLQCGILGSGMRPLLVGNLPPQKTLTVMDVNLVAADTVYTTYNAMTMKVIDQQTLPRLIPAPNGKVLRRDVELADLTPEERAMKYTPSTI